MIGSIRELGAADVDAATRLWDRTGLTRPWNPPAEDFQRAIDGPSSTVLGNERGEALIGTVMVGHDGHRGWIYYLAVDPKEQGQGTGAALVRAAEAWLAEQGAVKVQLMIRADNPVAGFYEQLGYLDQSVTVLGRSLDGRARS